MLHEPRWFAGLSVLAYFGLTLAFPLVLSRAAQVNERPAMTPREIEIAFPKVMAWISFSNIPELNIRLHAGGWFAKRGLSKAPEKEFVTVGGLVLSKLDHIPRPGEQLSHGGWRFEITEMDGARISKVLATPCPQRNKAANF